MSASIAIASLSIKAINTYFNSKEEKVLREISKQNEELIALNIYQYNQNKISILQRANQEMHDGVLCSDPFQRKNILMAAYQDYTSLCVLPHKEQLPNGTFINNEELISLGYWGRFLYFGYMNEYRNCAIQVYECAIQFPHRAVKLFKSSFFPQIDCSQLSELCDNIDRISNFQPLLGIYSNIPDNMAKALIEMQINKYKERFEQILTSLNTEQYE